MAKQKTEAKKRNVRKANGRKINESFNAINFKNVTKEKLNCGFRHEEFPDKVPTKSEQERYMYLMQRSDEIQKLIYNIPRDLNETIINLYIKNIIEIKLDNNTYIREWWNLVCEKYKLPCSIKYNVNQNKFYRHITDDDQVTNMDHNN